jgi:co-chaperonin GroES (HSP10)
MSGFKPSRGKIALRHIGKDCESETGGIIYTKKEHAIFGKAQVLSIGHPEIVDGKEVQVDFEVGDYVLYNHQEGWGEYSGVRLVKPSQIIAVIDEDTEIE